MTFEIPQDQTDIPDGTYKAQLLGTSIRSGGKFTSPQNPDGNYRVWDWAVEVGGEIVPLSDTTSINNGPKTVAYARLTALLGKAPQAGDKIEDPTGKTVVLTIGHKENGFNKIEQVGAYVDPQQTLPGVPR